MEVAELSELLTQAREKNGRLGVTGMLLYRLGAFLQLLEGEPETLQRLYKTIRADARHRNVVTLLDDPTEERNFADWSMGFRHFGDMHPDEIPEGFSQFMLKEFDTSDFESSTFGHLVLLSFRQINV